MFKIITGINESKTLIKHISCKCKCKFDKKKCNSDQCWNNDKCQCECKKCNICEKDYTWNPATYTCENVKYLASIMDDSAIICDEVIESYRDKTNFNEILMNFYILLAFLWITTTLLIAVSIYCYLIKDRAKWKYLLPFNDINNELEQKHLFPFLDTK